MPVIKHVCLFMLLGLVVGGCHAGPGKATPSSNFPTGDQRPLIGVHTLELLDGVTEKEFDTYVAGPYTEFWKEPIGGVQVRIEKGDRGVNDGKYYAIWAFESVALRNSYFPDTETATPLFHEQLGSRISAIDKALYAMCQSVGFTDFVILYSTPPVKGTRAPSLYGVHDITLRPGVNGEDFEAFVVGPYAKAWAQPIAGLGHAVLKGERGEEVGAYKSVIRFTPAGLRDRYFPGTNSISKEFQEKIRPQLPHEITSQFDAMIRKGGFTDYAPVESGQAGN